jgi:hypothetical protein
MASRIEVTFEVTVEVSPTPDAVRQRVAPRPPVP